MCVYTQEFLYTAFYLLSSSFCLQEYEETIKSLRAQINILQQRAGVLQDELDQRYSSHKRSSKQYKNT